MKRAWIAFWGEITGTLELRATEQRTAIRLIEAVAVDEFEMQLRLINATEEGRADLREIAITAGKLGLRESDIEPMARSWHTLRHRLRNVANELTRYAEGEQ